MSKSTDRYSTWHYVTGGLFGVAFIAALLGLFFSSVKCYRPRDCNNVDVGRSSIGFGAPPGIKQAGRDYLRLLADASEVQRGDS
jgi:hypothetical protein